MRAVRTFRRDIRERRANGTTTRNYPRIYPRILRELFFDERNAAE